MDRDRTGLTAQTLQPAQPVVSRTARANWRARAAEIPTEIWIVGAITALAAVLRFATLTSQSYWYDEATTAHEVSLSFAAMFHAVRVNESTPPLYYVLAWIWARVFGTGEAGLRSLSALAGISVIPITYLCARELVSRAAGYVAAALAAVSPFMIWYSQEARAYMLFAAFCGLSLLFFARAWREPSSRNIRWWAACSILAILTHFFAGFLVAPEAVWLLLRFRGRTTMIAAGLVAAVQIAVIPLAVGDLSHPNLLGWIKQFPLHIRIEQVPIDFALSTLYEAPAVSYGLLAGAMAVVVAAGLIIFGSDAKHRQGAGVAALLGASVVVLPLLLAELGRDYYVVRNLIPAWVPLAIVIGAACTAPRSLPVGLPVALIALGGFVYAGIYIDQHQQYQRPNWRGAAAALGKPIGRRAVVVYQGGDASQPMTLYLRGVPWTAPPDVPITIDEVDVVGNTFETSRRRLPRGVRALDSHTVDGILVKRFALNPAWRLTPAGIGARATSLLAPAPTGPAVIIQP